MTNEATIKPKITELLAAQQSLFLATINAEGQPFASYAPYICDFSEGVLYVFISELAGHTHNLQINPEASVLIIEDEQDSEQIYARLRLQYQVVADQLPENKEEIMEMFSQRHGNVIQLLQSLPDFSLFKLSPQGGRYVEGFGRAYHLDKGGFASSPEHISPQKP